MKYLAILLLGIMLSAGTGAADRMVFIALDPGDAAGQEAQAGYWGKLVWLLEPLGFQENTHILYDKAELVRRFSEIRHEPGERLWIFLYGHTLLGRRELFLKLPQGVITAKEFTALLDAAGGEQMVFCFTPNARELQDALAGEGRIVFSPVSEGQSKNPPELPRFLVPELAKEGSWAEIFRRAAVANQEDASRQKLYRNEMPRLTLGGTVHTYPFDELDDRGMPKRRASGQRKAVAKAAAIPKEYPECELYSPVSERSVIVGADGAVTETGRDSRIVLSERALREYRSFRLERPAHAMSFEVRKVEYTRPDGTPGEAVYDARTHSISVRELEPGGMIGWEYSSRTTPGQVGVRSLTLRFPLGALFLRKNVKFSIVLPKEAKPGFRFTGFHTPQRMTAVEERYGKRYSVELAGVAAYRPEPFMAMPEEYFPSLRVSTVPSWEALIDDYSKILAECDKLDPDTEALAKRLAEGETVPAKILEKLYKHINEIRYDTTPVGIRALRPRLPREMFAAGYGDCKDKANALVAMARVHGIEGHFALLARGGNRFIDSNFPNWQFNHAVAFFPEVSGGLWLDPTDPGTPFGSLPPGDYLATALPVRPGKAELIPVTKSDEELSCQELTLEYGEPGAPVRFTLAGSGLFLYYRNHLDRVEFAARRQAELGELLYDLTGAAIMELDDGDPARITGTLEYCKPEFRLPRFLQLPFIPEKREYPLQIFDGQPFRCRLRVKGALYNGEDVQRKAHDVSWRLRKEKDGFSAELSFGPGLIGAEKYPAVRKLVKMIGESGNE